MQLVKPLVRIHEPALGSPEAVRISHAISTYSLGFRMKGVRSALPQSLAATLEREYRVDLVVLAVAHLRPAVDQLG